MDTVHEGLALEEEKATCDNALFTCKCVSPFFHVGFARHCHASKSASQSCAISCARLMRVTEGPLRQRVTGLRVQLLQLVRLPTIVCSAA
jgi:hypothetical protein